MITLYSTNCPKCKVLEAKLDQAGISYLKETDVKKMTEKGFLSAPMLETDDGKILDFSEALGQLNHRSGTDLGVVETNVE